MHVGITEKRLGHARAPRPARSDGWHGLDRVALAEPVLSRAKMLQAVEILKLRLAPNGTATTPRLLPAMPRILTTPAVGETDLPRSHSHRHDDIIDQPDSARFSEYFGSSAAAVACIHFGTRRAEADEATRTTRSSVRLVVVRWLDERDVQYAGDFLDGAIMQRCSRVRDRFRGTHHVRDRKRCCVTRRFRSSGAAAVQARRSP